MFKQEIHISPELQAMIRNCGDKRGVGMSIARALDRQNEKSVDVVQGKLSGTLLRVRSGRLRESMQRTDAIVISDTSGNQVRSSVGSNVRTGGDAVSYAAPLEFGSKPHLIRPLPGRGPRASLRFIGRNGEIVFARSVNHPGNPAYGYLGGTIADRLPIYSQDIGDSAFKFITGGTN